MCVCVCICIYMSFIYIYTYVCVCLCGYIYVCVSVCVDCYGAMCPTALLGAVRSRQVYQLQPGTQVRCGLPTVFNVADITNSLAESHFDVTWWVIGELLKFNEYNTSRQKKDSELPCFDPQV